jgi:hypothetical protein
MARTAGGVEEESARLVRGLALTVSGQADAGFAEASGACEALESLGSRREAALAWRELAEALLQRDMLERAVTALRRAADCAGVRSTAIHWGVPLPMLAT